ncbi:MAG TPA: arylsulfatase [Thermoanaerobaculales bacterium]|nr:arylsulfatase [Thermoanaerobaculales bacterium]HPA80954.1 arylsulfatase [Thermoanaerobaculales bacterium]HQN96458.1 arylsulfatase [Thermoanaerobaculales bacterium]HQP42102.1 arylsulfatase [Thermoanaerobaculales bacterium]
MAKGAVVRTVAVVAVALAVGLVAGTAAAQQKPNIVVIWGDDIGGFNISAYNQGMMGYRTPSIDSIAQQGALFTDWYGQQSCTAGRAAFVTGQSPIRTGLTKVGLPGAPEGMRKEDPTIATLLKAQGYTTGQFGKNHLGDRDEMLPTNHGFDEFFGNLYHLNAEEEPENPDYPKSPEFRQKFGPRGVIHSFADGRIEDTGPLTRKRMETIDEEVTAKALDFMERAANADKPFFLWWNSTRMHIFTHLKAESDGKTGLGVYADGMVEHDGHVGQVLAKLKELGLDDNTIVMYSTDNGAETFTWPDGGTTMFRGEKNTQWEGGYRVPCMIRWPGVIKPGTLINDIGAHEDMLTTLLAAAGDTTVKEDLLKGRSIGGMTYKVHLDGYDLGPALRGEAAWPRKEFIYWTDDGQVAALRHENWKITFLKQEAEGLKVWQEPFTELRAPLVTNLRMDPFERAEEEHAMGYQRWYMEHMFAIAPAGAYVGAWLQSFREFPPRQKPGSFTLERAMETVMSNTAN